MTAPYRRPPDSPQRWRAAAARPRRQLVGAVVGAVLAGALLAYGLDDDGPARDGPATPAPGLAAQGPPPTAALPVPPVPTPTASADPAAATAGAGQAAAGQTASLSLAELQELQQVWSSAPDPSDEFTRLTEQALLSDATQRFLQLRASGSRDAAELRGLADVIGPVLDAQVRRGDLARAAAVDLKRQLLELQYPQVAMQHAELARWVAGLPAP